MGSAFKSYFDFQKVLSSLSVSILFIPKSRGYRTYQVKNQSTSSGEKSSSKHEGLVLFDLSNST